MCFSVSDIQCSSNQFSLFILSLGFFPKSRYFMVGLSAPIFLDLDPNRRCRGDATYTSLPFYHIAASGLVVGSAVCEGVRMVARKRFSASAFWRDCAENGVTVYC